MEELIKIETNWFKRFWIRIWYNDIGRILIALIPLPLIPIVFLLVWLGLSDDTIATVCVGYVLIMFGWGMVDNDYDTNNKRIGRDPYGKKIR